MGKKLDALLGRNFRASKFKTLTKLAISRISILKNQHRSRYSYSRSDVVELLNLGHQDRALLRVEHVIKEQNMLDVFGMLEYYCYVLIEKVDLIQKNKECPDELKEAASSLIFASSRCGECPELMHIREILSSRFGIEFAGRAVESRSNSNNGVNHKMKQKLSTGKLSFDDKLKMLKEIASEIGITVNLEDSHPAIVEEKLNVIEKKEELEEPKESPEFNSVILRDVKILPGEMILDEDFSNSVKKRMKYRDVAAAAQEAFESAAYAAEAAKAAVELSRTESDDRTSDDESGISHQKSVYDSDESSSKSELENHEDEAASEQNYNDNNPKQIHPIHIDVSESENEEDKPTADNNGIGESKKKGEQLEKIPSFASSSDADDFMDPSCEGDEANTETTEVNLTRDQHVQQQDTENENGWGLPFHSLKWVPTDSEADAEKNPMARKNIGINSLSFAEKQHSPLHTNTEKRWVSMRTRREHRD